MKLVSIALVFLLSGCLPMDNRVEKERDEGNYQSPNFKGFKTRNMSDRILCNEFNMAYYDFGQGKITPVVTPMGFVTCYELLEMRNMK